MSETLSEKQPGTEVVKDKRLFSLDVYRGLVMTLLIAEGAGVYVALYELGPHWARVIAEQCMHPAWDGLRFWDLVQPAFMFIVGVSMVFSMRKRAAQGQKWPDRFAHILVRCFILFLLGTGLHCIYAGKLVFELWNVLTQLSVTILIAFLIMELPFWVQLLISLALIGASDAAYRFILIAPYDQPFTPGENFGSYIDMLLMGHLNSDNWVAFNAIPSAAHTIWGVLAGRAIVRSKDPLRGVLWITLFGLVAIGAGYGLEAIGYAPIIKRTCTGPFVLISGGWCLLALAAFYSLIDGIGFRFGGWIVAVVGMNSILIYMIAESFTYSWLNPKVGIFVVGWLTMAGVNEQLAILANALVVWLLLWLLCVWLYRRKVFVKI